MNVKAYLQKYEMSKMSEYAINLRAYGSNWTFFIGNQSHVFQLEKDEGKPGTVRPDLNVILHYLD